MAPVRGRTSKPRIKVANYASCLRQPERRAATSGSGSWLLYGADGTTAQAWLQTGESYVFTAAASIGSVEEALIRSLRGAFSPAAAFGADFALTVEGTARTDAIPAGRPPAKGLKK